MCLQFPLNLSMWTHRNAGLQSLRPELLIKVDPIPGSYLFLHPFFVSLPGCVFLFSLLIKFGRKAVGVVFRLPTLAFNLSPPPSPEKAVKHLTFAQPCRWVGRATPASSIFCVIMDLQTFIAIPICNTEFKRRLSANW